MLADYIDYILFLFPDMPVGDEETVSEFGDDDFLRQNNILLDDTVSKPYWEQALIDRTVVKVNLLLK